MQGRRLRDLADARQVLARWRASGQPCDAWCRDHAISRESLKYWQTKLAHRPSGLVEVVPEPALIRSPSYRLVLDRGVLEFGDDASTETLIRVVRALAEC